MSSFSLLFLFLYFLSFFFVVGCDSVFFLWVGLEMNMMSFISLIYKKEMIMVECSLSYFFVQSLGSVVFMLCLFSGSNFYDFGVNAVMVYKMGAGPFFFWFPAVCSALSWAGMFFMMTFQKVIPCIIMSNFYNSMSWGFSAVSLLVGVLGSLNELNLKYIMAYSSIHHVGWLILSMMFDGYDWWIYLFVYSFIVFTFNMYLSFFSGQMLDSLGFTSVNKLVFVFILMNMGGLPPFIGFFLKWWIFNKVIYVDYSYLFFLVIFSVMMFYIYLRLGYTILMKGVYFRVWNNYEGGFFLFFEFVYVLGVVVFPLVMMANI